MITTIHTGYGPSWPVTSSKRKTWIKRLKSIETVITQAGATATYRPIGHFEIEGTRRSLEAARKALAHKRVTWEEN